MPSEAWMATLASSPSTPDSEIATACVADEAFPERGLRLEWSQIVNAEIVDLQVKWMRDGMLDVGGSWIAASGGAPDWCTTSAASGASRGGLHDRQNRVRSRASAFTGESASHASRKRHLIASPCRHRSLMIAGIRVSRSFRGRREGNMGSDTPAGESFSTRTVATTIASALCLIGAAGWGVQAVLVLSSTTFGVPTILFWTGAVLLFRRCYCGRDEPTSKPPTRHHQHWPSRSRDYYRGRSPYVGHRHRDLVDFGTRRFVPLGGDIPPRQIKSLRCSSGDRSELIRWGRLSTS